MGEIARKRLGMAPNTPEVGHFLADTLQNYFTWDDLFAFAALLIQTQAGTKELNSIHKDILKLLGERDVAGTLTLLPVVQKDRDFVDSLEKASRTSAFQA